MTDRDPTANWDDLPTQPMMAPSMPIHIIAAATAATPPARRVHVATVPGHDTCIGLGMLTRIEADAEGVYIGGVRYNVDQALRLVRDLLMALHVHNSQRRAGGRHG